MPVNRLLRDFRPQQLAWFEPQAIRRSEPEMVFTPSIAGND
jgi:hypothetical protein